MASTNKTTNYELSQFIETDRPAWLTDYNGDMRTIDSTMKAISDVASGASGSISELADRMSTAEGNITTNTNDIAALDARADALEAGAQSTAGTIANIQTEQTAQNMGIEAATELGYNLARPYDSASTYAVGAYVLFQNTLYKCVTAVPTGEAFDPTKWLAIKATDEIAAGGYTLPIASADRLGGVKVGDGLNIDPLTGILSAGGITEFIPITTNDYTVDSITYQGDVKNNYYSTSDSASGGSQAMPTGSFTLSNSASPLTAVSYILKIGNMRVLHLQGTVNFGNFSLNGKYVLETNMASAITSDILDAPSIGNCIIPYAGNASTTEGYSFEYSARIEFFKSSNKPYLRFIHRIYNPLSIAKTLSAAPYSVTLVYYVE